MADYPDAVQHSALKAFQRALDCQWRTLQRDDCGTWAVFGKFGRIWAVPGIPWGGMEKTAGFQIYLKETGSRAWTFAKREFQGFTRLTQDGDDEGVFFLDRFPTENQAHVIRSRLGIKKRKVLSDEHRAALVRAGSTHAFQRSKSPNRGSEG